MLVSVPRYQDVTGDTTSATADVNDRLVDAQALLEEHLQRPLETGTRTERCRIFREPRGNALYPAVTPIASVSSPAGAEVVGAAVLGGDTGEAPPYFLTDPDTFAEITYIGGFDPDAETGDADLLPRTLERAIIWAAYAELHRSDIAVPAGATSVSVGDVSISWGPGGSPATGEVTFPRTVRKWRRRRDLAA